MSKTHMLFAFCTEEAKKWERERERERDLNFATISRARAISIVNASFKFVRKYFCVRETIFLLFYCWMHERMFYEWNSFRVIYLQIFSLKTFSFFGFESRSRFFFFFSFFSFFSVRMHCDKYYKCVTLFLSVRVCEREEKKTRKRENELFLFG